MWCKCVAPGGTTSRNPDTVSNRTVIVINIVSNRRHFYLTNLGMGTGVKKKKTILLLQKNPLQKNNMKVPRVFI